MKIIAWQCVCPQCRFPFTGYLASNYNPPHDEIAHHKRAVLCNVCERAFVNTLYRRVQQEVLSHGGLALEQLHLSALSQEAQRAGEPRHEAEVGTVSSGGVSGGVQGMPHRDRNASMEDRVPKSVEQACETLRGESSVPHQQPERRGSVSA